MNTLNAIKSRRTTRKFKQTQLSHNDIYDLIDAARVAPTGANLQSLKYMIVADKDVREKMFPHIKYAGYIRCSSLIALARSLRLFVSSLAILYKRSSALTSFSAY